MEDSSPGPPPPPSDADDWTEEQWIAWLEAVDAAEDPPPARAPRRLRDRPASMLGNAMLGLHEVIYGRPDEIVIVADAGGDPPRDDRPELFLHPDHPERSEVMIRRRPPPAPEAEGDADGEPEGSSHDDPAEGPVGGA